MTRSKLPSLFDPFFSRATIGFDSLFDNLSTSSFSSAGYPFYNIKSHENGDYEIELAVAGFSEGDIDVELDNGVLKVSGHRTETKEDTSGASYLYQGITDRSFSRSYQLAENVEVDSAELKNGMLRIKLKKLVLEEHKPKKIPLLT